jgi:UDPglucose 6-dehydrogenase
MNLLMIGTGYVGLVTGACLAEMGHHVICLDIDEGKIAALQQGAVPIYEPGLEELVKRNVNAGRLTFTSNYKEAVQKSKVCFIAVPTPSREDGSCDVSFVLQAAASIAEHMTDPLIIVTKSTVPVGTAVQIRTMIEKRQKKPVSFDVVSNPEFLKEGAAVTDCMKPDRIILGVESSAAAQTK